MNVIPRSPAVRASIGLALGLAVGIAISLTSSAPLRSFAALEPIGTIWVNAIRMTVIPLVVSLLIATIADEKDLASVGRLGGRAVAIFVVLLSGCALLGFLAGPPLFTLLDIDAASAASLRGTPPRQPRAQLPTFSSWLVGLIPRIHKGRDRRARCSAHHLAVLFAAALARTPAEFESADAFLRGIADAMLHIVG